MERTKFTYRLCTPLSVFVVNNWEYSVHRLRKNHNYARRHQQGRHSRHLPVWLAGHVARKKKKTQYISWLPWLIRSTVRCSGMDALLRVSCAITRIIMLLNGPRKYFVACWPSVALRANPPLLCQATQDLNLPRLPGGYTFLPRVNFHSQWSFDINGAARKLSILDILCAMFVKGDDDLKIIISKY